MSLNTSNASESTTTSAPVANRIKFGLFLTLQIPSLVCSVYLFVQYATRPHLYRSMHHHVFIVLLCSSFLFVIVPVSASEAFFYTSTVRPASYLFCSIWTWVHYTANIGNLMLMAFACAERHWLLFRLNSLRTQRMRVFYHYLPIAACMCYPALFYFVLIFLYPCEPVYDFNQLLCIMPCYFMNALVGSVDTFLNNWTPIFAIPLLSSTLFIRFLFQKRQVRMAIFQWKRDRKMVIQLLVIASLYVLMWAPLQSLAVYNLVWPVRVSRQFQIDYLFVLPYFIHFFYPFVVLFSNSELRRRKPVQPEMATPLRRTDKIHTLQASH